MDMNHNDAIINILRTRNVFLTGKAGTGKTYITREIIEKIGKGCIVLASTGMAAVNIGGQTVHSFFKLGISNNMEELQKSDELQKQKIAEKYPGADPEIILFSKLRKILSSAHLIIIDEISMISSDVLDLIFYRFKRFSQRRIPILAVGDFYQLPPVNGKYAFKSENWNFKTYELEKIKRTSDVDFAAIQGEIRKGNKNDDIISYIQKLSKNIVDKPLRIFSRRVDVEEANKVHLDSLPGELMKIQPEIILGGNLPNIKSIMEEFKIDELLEFKIGARIMIIVNNFPLYYNGLMGTIENFDSSNMLIKTDDDKSLIVQKYVFEKVAIDEDRGQIRIKPIAKIAQFPIMVAAAITIHKSQGSSIEKLSIDCDKIFEKGQFYVAISRSTNPKLLSVTSFDENYIMNNLEVDEFYAKKE